MPEELVKQKGTVTNAALLVEIDGSIRQAILPHVVVLQLVNVAEALNEGRLVLSQPIPFILPKP